MGTIPDDTTFMDLVVLLSRTMVPHRFEHSYDGADCDWLQASTKDKKQTKMIIFRFVLNLIVFNDHRGGCSSSDS